MAPPHISNRIRELTRPTGEEDLLNVRYPAPRFHIPFVQAIIVIFLLLAGAAVWFACSAGGEDRAADDTLIAGTKTGDKTGLPPLQLSAHPAEAGNDGASGVGSPEQATAMGESEPSSVVVSVVGKVAKPGLVTLAPGARVADALAAAEPGQDADVESLNHAQKLADGQQIVVTAPTEELHGPHGESYLVGGEADSSPAQPERGASDSAGGDGGKSGVNLNTADVAELKTLSGVGEVTAEAIVSYREEHGPFTDVSQLLEVSGIGPAKFAQLEGNVTL